MVFWRCKKCGRLHDYVVYNGEPIILDDWLTAVNEGSYGGGNVYASLRCSKCDDEVGVIGSSRSILAGFSFRGDVHFIYFDTVEGAIQSNPDRSFLSERVTEETPNTPPPEETEPMST